MAEDSDLRRDALNKWVEADEAYDDELDQYFAVAVGTEPIVPANVIDDKAMQQLRGLRTARDDARQRDRER